MPTADKSELIEALRRLSVETGSLACLGCGHEHGCSVHGCALIQAAIKELSGRDNGYSPKNIVGKRSDIVEMPNIKSQE